MTLTERYLDLLAKSVLNELYLENDFRVLYLKWCRRGDDRFDPAALHDPTRHRDWTRFRELHAVGRFLDDDLRNLGYPQTMVGRQRLDHLRGCLETVLRDQVPGDLMECGVWRGGVGIFMRGFLAAHGISGRSVWLADSFRGLPAPQWQEDAGLDMSASIYPMLAVPLETVREAFARYGLLDGQVRFLEGWFQETLPHAEVDRLAVLRIDADLYQSTTEALEALYPKVEPGGFVIIDDYQCIGQCRSAVDDFRERYGIADDVEKIDWTAVYWRKSQR